MLKSFAVKYLLLAGLLIVPATGVAGTLNTMIDKCISTILQDQKSRNEKIKIELDYYCPDLPGKIRRSSVSKNLSYRFDSVSSIAELRDIKQFLVGYRIPGRKTYSYNYSEIGPLLEGIFKKSPEEQKGMWEQFFQWIKQYLPDPDEDDLNRFDEFLGLISMPNWLSMAILYVSGGVILMAAFWVLYREWRYYRRTGTRRYRLRRGSGSILEAGESEHAISLEELSNLPLKHRVPALLNWMISQFVQRGILPVSHSLTNRELLGILKKQKEKESKYFLDLLVATELVVYGNYPVEEQKVNSLIESAKSIQNENGAEAL